MRINNTNSPQFKKTYIFQVPKSSLQKPNDLDYCLDVFAGSIKAAGKSQQKTAKAFIFVENPGYSHAKRVLNYFPEYSNCSIHWLNQNAKTDIEGPFDENSVSFMVFTDEEYDKAVKTFNKNTNLKYCINMLIDSFKQKGKKEAPILNQLAKEARYSEHLNEKALDIIGDSPALLVKTNDLKDLTQKIKLTIFA